MNILNYIDFWEIYNKVKKNQLELYPTAQEYINQEFFEGSTNWITEMYQYLENPHPEADFSEMSEYDIESIYNGQENTLTVELTVGGNSATENGDDYWGYGWEFKIDLDTETFVGFQFNNYS